MRNSIIAVCAASGFLALSACDGARTVTGVDVQIYDSCSSTATVAQFPVPSWERAGNSPTGVLLRIPSSDAAGVMLRALHREWYDQFPALDGVPLNTAWFVALKGVGTAADAGAARLFSNVGGKVTAIPAQIRAELSETGGVLILKASRPIPTPARGEQYILALYEGAVSGARPIPACGTDGKVQQGYTDAAAILISNGFGANLQYALPFQASRATGTMPALYSKLLKEPVLKVERIEAGDHTWIPKNCDCTPKPETLAVLQEKNYSGIFVTPDYQSSPGGAFVVDASTLLPVAQGETRPGFYLVLPKAGTAPYPVIVYQHGGSCFKQQLYNHVKPYAEAGFAVLSVDLPLHGDRSINPGGNASIPDVIDIQRPQKIRDYFRQAAADHLAEMTGMEELNKALEPLSGLSKTLDASRMFVIGHSMGSLTSTISSGVNNGIKGASLIAGGGPFEQMVRQGLFTMFVGDILDKPKLELEQKLALFQYIMDAGDPVNYAARFEDRASQPKDILVWEGIDDPIMNNPATDRKAVEIGAVLMTPFHHGVAGMQEAVMPLSGNFGWAGVEKKGTRAMFQISYPEELKNAVHALILNDPLNHAITAGCFASRLKNGVCTLAQP